MVWFIENYLLWSTQKIKYNSISRRHLVPSRRFNKWSMTMSTVLMSPIRSMHQWDCYRVLIENSSRTISLVVEQKLFLVNERKKRILSKNWFGLGMSQQENNQDFWKTSNFFILLSPKWNTFSLSSSRSSWPFPIVEWFLQDMWMYLWVITSERCYLWIHMKIIIL